MNQASNGKGPPAKGGQDGKRAKPGTRKGGKLDGGRLDDVAGGAVISAYPVVDPD